MSQIFSISMSHLMKLPQSGALPVAVAERQKEIGSLQTSFKSFWSEVANITAIHFFFGQINHVAKPSIHVAGETGP